MEDENKVNLNESERLEARAKFVANFINANSRKGIKVTYSVKQLSTKVLFVSEKTVYNDLRRARTDKHY